MYGYWERVQITRDELYEKVWSQPMVALSASYGVSDVALAKLCKKLDVPRPPRGYWAKLECGKPAKKIPLPKAKQGQELRGSLPKRPPREPGSEGNPLSAKEQEYEREHRIKVAQTLSEPDAVVEQIERAFRTATVTSNGFLASRLKDPPTFHVSEACRERALRILDTLTKALRTRGFEVSLAKAIQVGTRFGVVEFCIEEQGRGEERPPTREEARREESYARYAPIFGKPHVPTKFYRTVPSGQLSLSIVTESVCGDRRRWADTKDRHLEDLLNSFVVGLVRIAENNESERLRREQARLAREEEERLRALARQARELENRRREDVWKRIECRARCLQVRDFAEFVRSGGAQCGRRSGSETAEWISWMLRYADELESQSLE